MVKESQKKLIRRSNGSLQLLHIFKISPCCVLWFINTFHTSIDSFNPVGVFIVFCFVLFFFLGIILLIYFVVVVVLTFWYHVFQIIIKNSVIRARKMTLCLTVLALLPKNLGLNPSTLMTSQLYVTPVPGGPISCSLLYGLCTHVVYRHTCRQSTPTQKIKIKEKFKWRGTEGGNWDSQCWPTRRQLSHGSIPFMQGHRAVDPRMSFSSAMPFHAC